MSHDGDRLLPVRFVTIFLSVLSLAILGVMLVIVTLHAYSPQTFSPGILSPLMYILAGSSTSAVVIGLMYSLLLYPQYRRAILVLVLITLALFAAHLYTIGLPATQDCHDKTKNVDGCVMDEVYYVPAAQTLLSGEKCAPYADSCNLEHPFLSKAFIAAGIATFGNNVFGWRIFQVILGTFSVPVLFGICWSITRNMRLSLYSAYLLAFETLFFVHSSIAVIDVQAIFLALVGLLFYFSRLSFWKFDSYILAGIALGLAGLSKETAVFLVGITVVYNVFMGQGSRRLRIFTSFELLATVLAVFIGGLQLYDTALASGSATTFIGQISFILSYGASLVGNGWTDTILHTPITPLNWITYYSPIGYLVTTVTVTGPSGTFTYIGAGYYGITNQFEIWLTYLWAAYTVYLVRKSRTTGLGSEQDLRDLRLAKLALLWFVLIIGSYVALYIYGRVTYPYYMIQAIPAVAMGCGFFLSRRWFPNSIAYVVLAGVMFWFFLFYPDKSFLPIQLRTFLGH